MKGIDLGFGDVGKVPAEVIYAEAKKLKPTPLPVPNARERCASSASCTSLMSLKKFFNT
jgi:hypothetical protein